MGILANYPKFRAADDNGEPLDSGLLYTYEAGTTTKKATYTAEDEHTTHSNPIVLDGNGEATVFLGVGDYKFVLTEPNVDKPPIPENVRWTVDNIKSINYATETIYKREDYVLVSSDMDGTNTFGTKGATSDVEFTLPAGGDNYSTTFINSEDNNLQVTASGTETIRIGDWQTAGGGSVVLSGQGTIISLRWDGYCYVVTNITGTITFDINGSTEIVNASFEVPRLKNLPTGAYYERGYSNFDYEMDSAAPTTSISFPACQCFDSTGEYVGTQSTAMTKSISAAWAAGTGNGGLLAGSLQANKVYNIYQLLGAGLSPDVGFLLDGESITTSLPGAYAKYQYRGFFRLDSSSLIMPFVFSDNVLTFLDPSQTYYHAPGSPPPVAFSTPPASFTALSLIDWGPRWRTTHMSFGVISNTAQQAIAFSVDGTNTAAGALGSHTYNSDNQYYAWGAAKCPTPMIKIEDNQVYWSAGGSTVTSTVKPMIHSIKIWR